MRVYSFFFIVIRALYIEMCMQGSLGEDLCLADLSTWDNIYRSLIIHGKIIGV